MNEDLVKSIANRTINTVTSDWAMDIEHFDWVPGVGLYGIYKAYKHTGEEKYKKFIIDWFGRHIKEAGAQRTVNSTAPLLTLIELYAECQNKQYLDVCKNVADYIIKSAPITVDGGLEHTVTEPVPGFTDQIWADTLFMVCIFIAKLYNVDKDKRYKKFVIEQMLIHHKLLSDGSGLYYHAYNGAKRDHLSAVKWGRANGWILYSTMEILNVIGAFDGREKIEKYVCEHIRALQAVQQKNGGFCTILDDPDSYIEISATSAICAGVKLAVNAGVVPEEFISVYDKGLSAVKNAVNNSGIVEGVSNGTPVMPDAESYKKIDIVPTLYGQGLAIIALVV